MAGYILQGGDGKEYGPVDEATLRSWIEEHRVLGTSLIRPEGGSFVPAKDFPEFASYFAKGDYCESPHIPEVDTGKALVESWKIFIRDPLRYFAFMLVFWGAAIGIALFPEVLGMALKPLVHDSLREVGTGLFSLAFNLILTGPLVVGAYRFALQAVDGGKPQISQLLFGFQSSVVGRAIGVQVVKFLLMVLVMVFGVLAAVAVSFALGTATKFKPEMLAKNPLENPEMLVLFGAAVLVVSLLVMVVVALLVFVEFLIADESHETFLGLFTKSSQLALSKIWSLGWYFTVVSLIWLAAFICLVIPALLITPWLMLSLAHVYRQLAGPGTGGDVPPASHGSTNLMEL